MRSARLAAIWFGALTGLFLGEVETLCRYLPALRATELSAAPAPALAATAAYVGLGALGGALHRWLGPALLVGLALASADQDAVGLLAVPAAVAAGWLASRRRAVAAVGIALVLLGIALAPREELARAGRPARPDLVLVVLDTVAAAHTSLHGAPLDTTPTLVALAREGIDWRSAIATAPWTVPSHGSLFTGAPARTAGAHHEHLSLPADLPTIAEDLAKHGYRTAAFVANPWLARDSGITRGFAHQQGAWEISYLEARFAGWRAARRFLSPRHDKQGRELVSRALAWLSRGGDEPSFVFLNLLEAHSPYQVVPEPGRFGVSDPEALGKRVREAHSRGAGSLEATGDAEAARLLYAAAVRAADDALGELVAGLRAAGRLERTALLVTSDHGEEFGEHGFVGHGIGLYERALHVPLVLRGPAGTPRGVRIEEPVSLERVRATLLEIGSGAPQPGSLLAPHEVGAAARPIVSEQRRPGWMLALFRKNSDHDLVELDTRALRVRVGSRVLLRETPARGGSPHFAFFDLDADPAEQAPRWPDPRAAELLPLLEAHDRLPVRGEGTPDLSPAARERLVALGYLSE